MRIFTSDRPLTPSWDFVKPSLYLLKKYIWHVLYLSFLPSLLALAGLVLFSDGADISSYDTFASDPRHIAGMLLLLVSMVWALLTMPAYTYLQVQAVLGKEPSIMECFQKGLRYLLPLVGMYLLAVILIVMGFIAFIIPGFLLIRGFLLAPYYVVDQNMGPVQALKQSYRDSRSVSLYVWGIIGVTAVFSILGSIVGVVPLFGTFLSLMVGYIYNFGEPLRYVEVVKGKLATLPHAATTD